MTGASKPAAKGKAKGSNLSKVEPKAGPRKFRTTMTKSAEGKANIARIASKNTGDQNQRENYNASRDKNAKTIPAARNLKVGNQEVRKAKGSISSQKKIGVRLATTKRTSQRAGGNGK